MRSFQTSTFKDFKPTFIVQVILYVAIITSLSFGAAYGLEFLKDQPFLSSNTRYALEGSITTLNPLFIRPYTTEDALSDLMFRGLFSYDNENKITGDLAASWEFLEEGKVINVVLSDDLEWSDGEPITAQDAVFTYSLTQDDDYIGWADGFFNKVDISASEDGKTVTFTLPSSYAPLLDTLTMPIIPQHVFDNGTLPEVFSKQFFNNPVTSGDYELVSYSQTPLTSDEQWQQLAFKSDEQNVSFELRMYPTQEAIRMAQTFGDVDGVIITDWWTGERLVDELAINSKTTSLEGHYYTLVFNLDRDISLDERKAFSRGIDRAQLPGYPATGPIIKASPYWVDHQELRVGFDAPAAQDALTGKEFTIVTVNRPEMKSMLQSVKSTLGQQGVVIKELYLPTDEFATKVLEEHDFDIALVRQYVGLDPDMYSFWHSSQIDTPGLNIANMKDRRVDKALEQGRTIHTIEERTGIYDEFQQYFLEEYPAVYITHPQVYILSRKDDFIEIPEKVLKLSDIFRYIE